MVGELLRQSIVSTTKTTLSSGGGGCNRDMVPPGTTMSAGSVLAAMALLVATAFSLGMCVGGWYHESEGNAAVVFVDRVFH